MSPKIHWAFDLNEKQIISAHIRLHVISRGNCKGRFWIHQPIFLSEKGGTEERRKTKVKNKIKDLFTICRLNTGWKAIYRDFT